MPGWAVCGSRDQPVPAGLSDQLECFRSERANLKGEVVGIDEMLWNGRRAKIDITYARLAAMENCHGEVDRDYNALTAKNRDVNQDTEGGGKGTGEMAWP